MAPLPPSNTQRWKYTYENAVNEHSVTFRTNAGATLGDVDAVAHQLFSVIGAGCSAFTVTGLEFADAGSDIFDPITGSSEVGDSFGSGTAIKQYDATAITFVGRAAGGRRARISLFGWKSDLSEFRLTAGESADVTSFVGTLNGVDSPIVAINAVGPVWHAYADIKANDHWVDKAR